MDYKAFLKHNKTDQNYNIYLLYGREQYLINWSLKTLKEKYISKSFEEMNYNYMDVDQINLDTLVNSCETLPIMSEKRLVVISDFSLLEGKKSKHFSEEDEKKLTAYLDNLPDYCILILTCGEKIDKRKSLNKKISKIGGVFEFSLLDPSDLKKWIVKRVKQSGKEIRPTCLNQLIEASGYYNKESDYTLYNLENDIDKLIHYMGDADIIDGDDVLQSIEGNIERNVFNLIDAISSNNKGEAIKILNQALLYGEAEYKILALLNRQFENLLHIKILKESGKDMTSMKEALSLPDFVISKLLKSSHRFSLEQLKKINVKIYESDKYIKTGVMESKLALEMLLAEI